MNVFATIKKQVSIVTVVSEYVTLKRMGVYWKGCCPFHHERTASFTVTPDREIFYCFGCHAGGDVISFIARAENCTQLQAAQQLAEKYGIAIEADGLPAQTQPAIDERKRYHRLCYLIANWCHEQLRTAASARTYLQSRKISAESIKKFTIGYFPTSGQAVSGLLPALQDEGYIAQDLLDARIALPGRSGIYFPFEDRIMFPIKDHLGRVCGFGGRVFKPDDTRTKYYNSHEHAFFSKSTLVFGLDVAKKSIQESGSVFLVEGYTDCIMMAQSGCDAVVATLGTACTADHLKLLSRYAQQLYIVYDGDAAGKRAVMRLAALCWQHNIDPLVIMLPNGEDPATYLAQDGASLAPLVPQAQDIFAFYIAQLEDGFTSKSLRARVTAVRELLDLVGTVQDALVRDMLLQQVSAACAVPLSTLQKELTKPSGAHLVARQAVDTRSTPGGSGDDGLNGIDKENYEISLFEKQIFSAIVNTDILLSAEDEEYLLFSLSEHLKPLFAQFRHMRREDAGATFSTFFDSLSVVDKKLISSIIIEQGVAYDQGSFGKLFQQFLRKRWKMMVNDVKIKLADAQKQGDAESVVKLVTEFQNLRQKMAQKGVL